MILSQKVTFIKNSFDTKSPAFTQIIKGVGMEMHTKNTIVF